MQAMFPPSAKGKAVPSPRVNTSPSNSATREYGMDILKVQEIAPASSRPASPTRPTSSGRRQLRARDRPDRGPAHQAALPTAEYNSFTVVIVLNVRNRVVGAVVDSVSDVLELSKDAVRPGPRLNAGSVDTRFITGIRHHQ